MNGRWVKTKKNVVTYKLYVNESRKKKQDPANNLYNYHHLVLFLPGRETLHPFVEIALGNVTSKLIIPIKISFSSQEGGNRQVGGEVEGDAYAGGWGGGK